MPSLPVTILGVPIQNISTDELLDECINYINGFPKESYNNYICTVNLDFLTNALSWTPSGSPNTELLNIYRKSAIATADGMPIILLSKLLGSPIKERITGRELLSKLAEKLGKNEKAIFLLGGIEKTSKAAAVNLHDHSPGLRVVGIATPPIAIQGEDLVNALERDELVADQINETQPDFLAINLGNPKQEIWFERIRSRLRVPLSMGIGGTLDVIGGQFKQTPVWMSKWGLEWLYRLYQDPKRLWKRYVVDFFKGLSLAFPLVIYHNFNHLCFKLFHSYGNTCVFKPLLFLSQRDSLGVIQMPQLLNKECTELLNRALHECTTQDYLALDFQNTRHIQPEGLSLLINIWLTYTRTRKEFYLFNLPDNIRRLLKVHRVWDLFCHVSCHSIDELVARLNRKGSALSFYDSIQQTPDNVRINFFGPLTQTQDLAAYLQKISPIIKQKNCILDFNYCTSIDNTGLCFLLNVQKLAVENGNSFECQNINSAIQKQLRLAKIDKIVTKKT